jgi:TRAP-type C4-dicarboxylate transport system permease small subunit
MSGGYAIALALYCLGWFNTIALCMAFEESEEGFPATRSQMALIGFVWPLAFILVLYLVVENYFRKSR